MFFQAIKGIVSKAAAEVGAVLFYDSFTDTDNTALGDHTPDIGTGWTETLAGGDPQIIGNVLDSQDTTEWATTDNIAADCVLHATIKNGFSQHATGLLFRLSDASNFWMLWQNDSGYNLYTKESGSFTYTDSNSAFGSNVNQTRSAAIALSGSKIKVFVDDELLWDLDDSTLSTNQKYGFRFYRSNGNTIDDYSVDSLITDPTDIDDCEIWLDASDRGSTTNQWDDKSGNTNHFTSDIAGEFPSFAGGVATFDGSNDHLDGPNLSALTEGEIFIVMKRYADNSEVGTNTGWMHFGGDTQNDHFTYSASIYSDFGSSARKDCGNPTPDISQYHTINIWSAASDWQMNIDGGLLYNTATNTVSFPSATTLGKSDGVYYFQGDIKAFILFSRKLTTAERAQMEMYCANL
jgi:hypothetical protein